MWDVLAEFGDTEFFPEETFAKENSNSNKNKKKNMQVPKRQVDKYLRYLSDEIIYSILVKASGDVLNNDAKLVCKAWKEMISSTNFIMQHATLTKPSLIVQDQERYGVKLMEVEEGKLDYKLHRLDLFRNCCVESSCNGLILRITRQKRKGGSRASDIEVMNLLTKKSFTLPSCPSDCKHWDSACASDLAFDPCSKKYKVVHAYKGGLEFDIFSLGVSPEEESWRRIPGPWEDIHQQPPSFSFMWNKSIVIGCIIHWYVSSDEYIISMDVSSEKFTRTPLPHGYIGISNYDLLDIGGKLSLIHKSSDTQIDVWILKDFDTRVWFLKHSIIAGETRYTTSTSLSSCNKEQRELPKFGKLIPLASARRGEVLIFWDTFQNFCLYLYDMERGEMKYFKMEIRNICQFIIPHRSTLCHWR